MSSTRKTFENDIVIYEATREGSESATESRRLLLTCAKAYAENRKLVPPADVVKKEPYGKPFFRDQPQIRFSISHSGKYWMCAFAQEQVGFDIQEYSHREYLPIATRFFHPDELDAVKKEGIRTFYEIWSAKESYIKYTGKGLSEPLKDFSVINEGKINGSGLGVMLRSIDIAPGHSAFLCAKHIGEILRVNQD